MLIDLLNHRPTMRHRNAVAYLTVRAWRSGGARRQAMAAFKLEKKARSPDVLRVAAAEIAAEIATFVGPVAGWSVTNIACGHSRDAECFGKQLARETANALAVPFVQVFEDRFVAGVSHPKEFRNLPPLQFAIAEPPARLILVDDLSTSGWHIEEAANRLREKGATVFSVAWIGSTLAGDDKAAADQAADDNALSTEQVGALLVTAETAAALLGITRHRIGQLEAEGYFKRQAKGAWPLADTVRGYLRFLREDERRSSKSAAESRVRDARAAEIELRVAERAHTLIEREEAEAAMSAVVGKIRTEFGGLPARVTRDLAVRRQIETGINDSLARVATQLRTEAGALRSRGRSIDANTPDDAGPMGGSKPDISDGQRSAGAT